MTTTFYPTNNDKLPISRWDKISWTFGTIQNRSFLRTVTYKLFNTVYIVYRVAKAPIGAVLRVLSWTFGTIYGDVWYDNVDVWYGG